MLHLRPFYWPALIFKDTSCYRVVCENNTCYKKAYALTVASQRCGELRIFSESKVKVKKIALESKEIIILCISTILKLQGVKFSRVIVNSTFQDKAFKISIFSLQLVLS